MTASDETTRDRPLCFVIGPFGADGSQTRKWSDFVFAKIIEPVLKDGYDVKRTIDDPEPGAISDRIERDLSEARVVIADLSDANPNVYFELGFRHALARPFIHVARAGTVLPFDIRDFEVISIHADYVEPRGFYAISDADLCAAHKALRAQLGKIGDRQDTPDVEPFCAKVFRWEMWYSPTIALDWLSKQPEAFREQVHSYERGGGADAIPDNSLPLFAEYLALKSAACQNGEGTIFVMFNNLTRMLELGHAVFKFNTAPEPILINVKDMTCAGGGVGSISFEQNSRPFPVERGGRTVNVMIPGYKYMLRVAASRAEQTGDSLARYVGTIAHPRSQTLIGEAELTPRFLAVPA